MTEISCPDYSEKQAQFAIEKFFQNDLNFEEQEAGIGHYEFWGATGYDRAKTWDYVGPTEFIINAPITYPENQIDKNAKPWGERDTIIVLDKHDKVYILHPVEINEKPAYRLNE